MDAVEAAEEWQGVELKDVLAVIWQAGYASLYTIHRRQVITDRLIHRHVSLVSMRQAFVFTSRASLHAGPSG
jgi:hypothetical protein